MASLYGLWPERRAATDYRAIYLPAHAGAKLLDVGCGDGSLMLGLAAAGWEVEGLEVDPLSVEVARSRGLKTTHGSLEKAGFPDGFFDAIVMSHVIEHAHDPQAMLSECHRILRPGGSLVVITPNAGAMGHRWFGSAWLHLDPPRHLHLFYPKSMEGLIKGSPFRNRRIFTTLRDASTLFHASANIRREGIHVWGSKPGLIRTLWTSGLVLVEAGLMLGWPYCGEELVAVVQKDQTSA